MLIGDFGVIAQLGLLNILAELKFDMVAEKTDPERFLDRVREVGPDVVVLDLDAEEGPELARSIAQRLCYSERTIKNIVHDVLVKTNCRTRAHAVALATRQGFI